MLSTAEFKIYKLYEIYKTDLLKKRDFDNEILRWQTKWSRSTDEKPWTLTETLQHTDPDLYPNVVTVITILLTMPMSTATPERSLSTMRRVKTCLRYTMKTVTRSTCSDVCLQRHTHWCRSRDSRITHQKEQTSSIRDFFESTKISDMFATNVSLVRSLRCCCFWPQPRLAAFLSIFHYFLFNMESWHLPINLRAQIAPDYISEYLNFQNFPGGHAPGPPSMSRLGLS